MKKMKKQVVNFHVFHVFHCLIINFVFAFSIVAQTLPPSRMPQAALHESMSREARAAVERGRETIVKYLENADEISAFPGIETLALCDPDSASYSNIVAEATARVFAVAEERISKPWEPEFAAEVAVAALAEAMNFNRAAPPRIVSRLTRVEVRTLPPADAAILLLALESNGADCRAKWRAPPGKGANYQLLIFQCSIGKVLVKARGR
ncbi:MAG: hypothetical protein FWG05_05475, partial [Kiritimatiellaeota bacterium]|nr:hypothetical protein [Kiritimatiellota bacterium]